MIKVIKNTPQHRDFIYQSELKFSGSSYYGAEYDGVRGFVASKTYGANTYQFKCVLFLSEGNRCPDFDSTSFEEIVDKILKADGKVYVFNTFLELAQWADSKA